MNRKDELDSARSDLDRARQWMSDAQVGLEDVIGDEAADWVLLQGRVRLRADYKRALKCGDEWTDDFREAIRNYAERARTYARLMCDPTFIGRNYTLDDVFAFVEQGLTDILHHFDFTVEPEPVWERWTEARGSERTFGPASSQAGQELDWAIRQKKAAKKLVKIHKRAIRMEALDEGW